jgi:hypothetical protein
MMVMAMVVMTVMLMMVGRTVVPVNAKPASRAEHGIKDHFLAPVVGQKPAGDALRSAIGRHNNK